jgi:uncharacterized protein (DUF2062 family)
VTVPNPPSSAPAPTFWQRRIVDPILAQLTQGITPEKIALTLAVGSACALFPILGTATILCLVVGIALRLNQPLIQLVNALCSVPHLFGVYGLIRLGDLIFGVAVGAPHSHLTISEFVTRRPHTFPSLWAILLTLWREHGLYFHRFGATALHALVAWAIIAPFWMFVVYRLVYPPLRKAARRHAFLLPAAKGPADGDIGP